MARMIFTSSLIEDCIWLKARQNKEVPIWALFFYIFTAHTYNLEYPARFSWEQVYLFILFYTKYLDVLSNTPHIRPHYKKTSPQTIFYNFCIKKTGCNHILFFQIFIFLLIRKYNVHILLLQVGFHLNSMGTS